MPEKPAEKLEIFFHGQGGIEILAQSLRHIGDIRTHAVTMGLFGNVASQHLGGPGLHSPRPRDDGQQAGFSDTVGTNQADHAASWNIKVQPVEGVHIAIAQGQGSEGGDRRRSRRCRHGSVSKVHLHILRPVSCWIEADPGHARQPCLDLLQMLKEQVFRYLGPYTKHEFLPFALGFNGLGRELGRTGHEGNSCRNDILRGCIKNDPDFGPETDPARSLFRQKECHVYVRQIDHVENGAAIADDFPGLSYLELNPPIPWRNQLGIFDICRYAGNGGIGGCHGGLGSQDLRVRRDNRCLHGLGLGPCSSEGCLRACHARAIIIKFLL